MNMRKRFEQFFEEEDMSPLVRYLDAPQNFPIYAGVLVLFSACCMVMSVAARELLYMGGHEVFADDAGWLALIVVYAIFCKVVDELLERLKPGMPLPPFFTYVRTFVLMMNTIALTALCVHVIRIVNDWMLIRQGVSVYVLEGIAVTNTMIYIAAGVCVYGIVYTASSIASEVALRKGDRTRK